MQTEPEQIHINGFTEISNTLAINILEVMFSDGSEGLVIEDGKITNIVEN